MKNDLLFAALRLALAADRDRFSPLAKLDDFGIDASE
jgi:hypothetical protein